MTSSFAEDKNSSFNPATLVEMLRWRAQNEPHKKAIIYLKDGEDEELPITYAELDQRARLIAAKLQELDGEGERALLLYPPSLEYIAAFFGCLYAGVIAVPAYPPRLNRPAPRIQAIVADSRAAIALTTPDILTSMEARFEHAPELEALEWVDTEELPFGLDSEWQDPKVSPDTLGFLQYTSGSTATPKGVMLSHSNLIHNLQQIRVSFRVPPGESVVSWLPSYHDMGLIGSILGSIYTDLQLTLLAPLDFLQRPIRWLKAITKYKAEVSGGPNFAYDLCVEKIKPEQIETLDLSSWRVAFSGAEPVRLDTMQRFAETFAACGFRKEAFYPCYGLAEGTLFVSGGDGPGELRTLNVRRTALESDRIEQVNLGEGDAQTLVACGSSKLGQKIVIANPETNVQCAPHEIGEIWLSGESVAQGYWNRTEENERTFGARLVGDDGDVYLRTGDLGFLLDNELYITGRLKDLIIIRGSNHYPQDIELTVERCHEALQPAGGGVFSIDGDGEERLVVVQEVNRKYRRENLDPAIQAIRKAIAEHHDLQVYAIVLIKPFTVPKTSSGKIQRHACKAKFLDGSLDVITQWQAPR
jgi:acyl-CoA synthetase (AMP-forming)/AMP-acid ligase II